jgi:hypothetical protein
MILFVYTTLSCWLPAAQIPTANSTTTPPTAIRTMAQVGKAPPVLTAADGALDGFFVVGP